MQSADLQSAELASGESLCKISEIGGIPSGKSPLGLLAELADAVDSKSTARKGISVRLR
jgi:hypothetical protein